MASLTGKSEPRILVVLENHPEAERLLRAAKRKSQALHQTWEVLSVDTPSMQRMKKQEREQLLRLRTVAEQMGAVVTLTMAQSPLQGVLATLDSQRDKGIQYTEIWVGTKPANWFTRFKPLLDKLLQNRVDEGVAVVNVPLGADRTESRILSLFEINLQEVLFSLLAVAMATFMIEMLDYLWPQSITAQHRNKAIIYMIGCAFVSGRYGLVAGLITALMSFVTYSLLYVAPYFRLIIDDPADVLNLVLFMLSAVIISLLGNTEHGQRQALVRKVAGLQSLLRVHRVTLTKKTRKEAVATLGEEITSILDRDIMLFMPLSIHNNRLEKVFCKPTLKADYFSEGDQKALDVCWQESKTTGVGSPYDPGCNWRFEPMLTAPGEIGVLAVSFADYHRVDVSYGRLITDIAGQAALILERIEMGQMMEEGRVQSERDKLRAMLLSSVSHDLKTPLASIIGSLSVYRSMGSYLPEDQRNTLLSTALDEAQRLDSFITNILDMTRIESGQIELKQDWIKPGELIQDVQKRLRGRLRNHRVEVLKGCDEEIEIGIDSLMTAQVLQNVLDNAAKYTPVGTKIDISWKTAENGFICEVRDHGQGIPDSHLHKVFDKYARINRQDSQVAGTGLGLAISKAVMEAQGGSISAANHAEGGAVFTLILPHWRKVTHDLKVVA